jgi:hypothetical protein
MSVRCHQFKIKCHFCNGNHECRDCPIEAEVALENRINVGTMFEEWVSSNIECPKCRGHLKVIGNHTPSLDLVCENPQCKNIIECKSKCLSVNKLPSDILLPHGLYYDFMYRLYNGLNLIVIIYGFDRINKMINVREVIYADNNNLHDPNVIKIKKRGTTNLSSICIKDKNKLKKICNISQNMSFKFIPKN